jgi:hypothetical protein
MELQQSPPYADYVRALGWRIETVDGVNIFHRHLPFIGSMAKIQRPVRLPYLPVLIPRLRELGVTRIVAEAAAETDPDEFRTWASTLSKFFRIEPSAYLATKTIIVDLTPPEETIFGRFAEAKRRGVRRAAKNGITAEVTDDLKLMMSTKAAAAGMFGSITTYGLDKLHAAFGPERTGIVLAYRDGQRRTPVGGVYLVIWEDTAYYWIAGATRQGKKLFAPTLLAWETMREVKRRGAAKFDFVGAWDERIPSENTAWKGFTKFKEGFGGTAVYYPVFRKRNGTA